MGGFFSLIIFEISPNKVHKTQKFLKIPCDITFTQSFTQFENKSYHFDSDQNQRNFPNWTFSSNVSPKKNVLLTVCVHFTPKSFHPISLHPISFHPTFISPHVHFTPHSFHPTIISPHVHFTSVSLHTIL